MATIQSAKEKYARKTGPGSSAAAKYNAAKATMAGNYAAGLAAFGTPAGPLTQAAYASGINNAQYTGGNPKLVGAR